MRKNGVKNNLIQHRTQKEVSQIGLSELTGIPRWEIQLAEVVGREIAESDQKKIANALKCTQEDVFPKEKEC